VGLGAFWDEGIAELARGWYVRNVLDRPQEFASIATETGPVELRSVRYGQLPEVELPSAYSVPGIERDGVLGMPMSALAAHAVDLVLARDRSFYSTLVTAQMTGQPGNARERIDGLAPGLFDQLRPVQPGEQEFLAAFDRLRGALPRESEEAAAAHAPALLMRGPARSGAFSGR
jgi:hypothetical protein